MRDSNLFVPLDCTVSNTKKENDSALALIRKFLKADTPLVFSNRVAHGAEEEPKTPSPSLTILV